MGFVYRTDEINIVQLTEILVGEIRNAWIISVYEIEWHN